MNTVSSLFDFTGKNMGVIVVTATGVLSSSFPITITDSRILANHVCIKADCSIPTRRCADWTVTTSDGSAVITSDSAKPIRGGAVTVKLYFALKTN